MNYLSKFKDYPDAIKLTICVAMSVICTLFLDFTFIIAILFLYPVSYSDIVMHAAMMIINFGFFIIVFFMWISYFFSNE